MIEPTLGHPLTIAETATLTARTVATIMVTNGMSEDEVLEALCLALEQGRIKTMLYQDMAVMVFDHDEVLCRVPRWELREPYALVN